MRERPIIFGGEMVRAILDGRKTQTRRVIRNPGRLDGLMLDGETPDWCPYGVPGDRLWVRETWAVASCYDSNPPRDVMPMAEVVYSATGAAGAKMRSTGRWRPSIHMPRWASRITLNVTAVRVERLQDISEMDAYSEGRSLGLGTTGDSSRRWFRDIWHSIHGDHPVKGWEANPWVWVVEFTPAPGGDGGTK